MAGARRRTDCQSVLQERVTATPTPNLNQGARVRSPLLRPGQVTVRRPIDEPALPVEAGAVARTIPGLFGVIPVHDTAEMRAGRRPLVEGTVLVPVDGQLGKTPAD